MNTDSDPNSDTPAKDHSYDSKKTGTDSGSGMLKRLLVMLVVFGVIAGGIWGYQEYLKSTIPKEDPDFIKKKSDNAPPEVDATGMELLSELFTPAEPSREIVELKKKSADEVVFTYDAIMAMTKEELANNIEEVSNRLIKVRNDLPPSLGGASAGSSGPPKTTAAETSDEPKDTATVPYLALSLEVMRQVADETQ